MSAKPILYYAPRSPPCRSVLLVAAEIGIDLDLRVINNKNGDNQTPEFLKLNPQHTIPVLDDNGTVIVDSHVICSYLADKYSTNENLYPRDLVQRCAVQTRMYFDCGNLFSRVRNLYEPVIYFGCGELPQEKIEYIQKAYQAVENYLKDQPYLCGQHLTIADLCCVASLSSCDQIAVIDEKAYPKLIDWMQRLGQLPYYDRVNREQGVVLQNFVRTQAEVNRKAKLEQ